MDIQIVELSFFERTIGLDLVFSHFIAALGVGG